MNIGEEMGVFIFAPVDAGTAPVEEAPVEEMVPVEVPEPVSV